MAEPVLSSSTLSAISGDGLPDVLLAVGKAAALKLADRFRKRPMLQNGRMSTSAV